eukprot:358440-Amphidinium_carterae.1
MSSQEEGQGGSENARAEEKLDLHIAALSGEMLCTVSVHPADSVESLKRAIARHIGPAQRALPLSSL